MKNYYKRKFFEKKNLEYKIKQNIENLIKITKSYRRILWWKLKNRTE